MHILGGKYLIKRKKLSLITNDRINYRFLNSIDDSVINPLAAELSRFLLNKLKLYLFQSDKFICNKHPIIVIPQRRKIDNE